MQDCQPWKKRNRWGIKYYLSFHPEGTFHTFEQRRNLRQSPVILPDLQWQKSESGKAYGAKVYRAELQKEEAIYTKHAEEHLKVYWILRHAWIGWNSTDQEESDCKAVSWIIHSAHKELGAIKFSPARVESSCWSLRAFMP